MNVHDLPALNASLNGTAAVLLAIGWACIRRGHVGAHRVFMVSALFASIAFLTSYLIYHAQVGSVRFPGQGGIRIVYLGILLTHTVLAAAIVPLVFVTLRRALRRDFVRHRAIARWTLPVWLYVSITGVVIYWMLYRVTWT
jgi:uncharacterized membrane protein YozB (DUF420 family)